MVFWNQATFVTYDWKGQERKAQLLSAVVCDGKHKNYAVGNEELKVENFKFRSMYFLPHENSNYTHLFCECNKVKAIWRQVMKYVRDNCILLDTLDWSEKCIFRGGSGGGPRRPGPPLITKNEAPAPKFYKIEAPEWQF